ncbi:MAG: hypothetical protein ABIT83_01785 [Massilia sp.]
MFDLLVIAFIVAMGGMAGLTLYELIDEVRGGSHALRDRFHD